MASNKTIADQAKSINLYKNLKIKVTKWCANICFNQQCLIKKVIPNYAKRSHDIRRH